MGRMGGIGGNEGAPQHKNPGAPEGPPVEEEMSSTELEIGSVPCPAVEPRT